MNYTRISRSWEDSKRQLALIGIRHGPPPYKGSRESLIDLVNKVIDTSLPITERKKYLYEVAQRLNETPAALQKRIGVSLI